MIVALDTAGPVAGAALLDGDRLLVRTGRVPRGTEVVLVRWIEELCAELGRPVTAIRGVGVAAGPGAFTGLRVGLATASGLALGLGVPAWADDSLPPRAEHAGLGGELVVMLDARKSRVYAARWVGEVMVRGPEDIAPEVALDGLGTGFRATGEGALVHRVAVEARGGRVVSGADDPGIGRLARRTALALARGEGGDPVALAPRYVRAPDAVPATNRVARASAGVRQAD